MNLLSDIFGTAIEIGILYSLEYTSSAKRKPVFSGLLFGFLGILIVIMTQNQVPVPAKLGVIFLCTIFLSKLCFRTGIGRITACYLLYLLAISIGEIVCFAVLRLVFGNAVHTLMSNALLLFFIILISKTVTLLFFVYIRHFFKKLQNSLGKSPVLTAMPLLACFFVLFVESFRIYSMETLPLKDCVFTGLNSFFMLLSAFCTVRLIDKYLQTKEIENAAHLDIEQISSSYHYLSQKTESEQQVRELYHDLKNHLLILKSKEEPSEYIDGLLNKIHTFEAFTDTGNAILNALLHEKCRFSEFYQIEWETCIDLNYTTPLKDFDLCTIFGNAIDNAMEACLNMDASENRYIRIFTGKIRKFLIIKIENSKKEEALPLDSEIRSTKAEASSHGYGLKSIRRTVHKYNGEMAVFLNRTSFTLRIAIPLSSAAS